MAAAAVAATSGGDVGGTVVGRVVGLGSAIRVGWTVGDDAAGVGLVSTA